MKTRRRPGPASLAVVRFLLVLAALAIAGTAAELAVRRLLPQFDPSGSLAFAHDSEYGVPLGPPGAERRLYKNSGDYDVRVVFNQHGLRDRRDIAGARRDDAIFVGDSFTFGWGVREDERFSAVFETQTGIRSFNLAVPTGVEGYQALLTMARDRGAEPGRVVIGICMENDLRLDAASDAAAEPDDAGRGTPVREVAKAWLTSQSALYVAVSAAVHQVRPLRALAARAGLLAGPLGENVPPTPTEVDAAAALTARIAAPYSTTVLIIPSRGLWLGTDTYAWHEAHRRFVADLRARHVDVLDLRPAIEEGGNPLQYYFRYDGHWNAAGHRLAAQALAAHSRR